MDLKLCARPLGRYVVVKAFGELDILTAPQFRNFLLETVDWRGPDIIIDGSDLGFMDSSGLAVLVGVQRRALAAGGSLRLATPVPLVEDQIVVAGLHKLIPTYPTVDAAAASTGTSPGSPTASAG